MRKQRPVMRVLTDASRLERYMEYVRYRPKLFAQDDCLRIILDLDAMSEYEQKNGRQLGVIYESPYNVLMVDLVEDANGKVFPYERIVPASTGASIVAVPVLDGKVILVEQFRHAIRRTQLAFPRGFGEEGLSAEENARKELGEEIGADVLKAQAIGAITPDSGLSSRNTAVVVCEMPGYRVSHEEGIVRTKEMAWDELRGAVADGKVDDAFTLGAFALCDSLGLVS